MQILPDVTDNIKETLDKSNLLRALLLLITKDINIWDHEVSIFIQKGIALGYKKDFCENAIRQVLWNSYKDQTPPVFFDEHEVHIFIKEGIALGYEKDFCENAIRNVLWNSYIDQTPPVFFNKTNALKILNIGIRIIKEDLKPHPMKIEFLEKIALANNLSGYWKTMAYNKIPKSEL